jgi:hypothetical protein
VPVERRGPRDQVCQEGVFGGQITALIADFQSLGSYREVRCVSGGDAELDSGSMVCVQSVRWKSPTGATR